MSAGHVIEQGTHGELLAAGGIAYVQIAKEAAPDVEVVDANDVRDALALFDSIDRPSATRVVARWRGGGGRPRRRL